MAVVDQLSVGPKLFKEASKQSVWLMFNEKSVRERKQIVRAGAYSQQMLCNLYSEKPLSLTMPEVERKIYPGFSHGDVIGYISCLGPSKLWRVPRLVVLSFECLSCQIIVSVFQNIFAAPLSGRTSSTSLAAGTCSFRPTQASKATASRQRMRQELESLRACSVAPCCRSSTTWRWSIP